MSLKFENKIIEIITEKHNFKKTFEEIVCEFETKLSNHNLFKISFDIEKYFNNESGLTSARNNLLRDDKIKEEWLRKYQTKNGKTKYDFKGLYIFLNKNKPFYVGISKGVIGRIIQHIKGHSHNASTLAYNISLINYELKNKEKYKGSRNSFNFKEEVEPIKKFLSKQKIAWIHIENDEELYLFEIYCAMKFGLMLNKFETH